MNISHPIMRATTWRALGLWLTLSLALCGAFAQDDSGGAATQETKENTPEAHMGAGYENLRNNRYEAAAKEFQAALALNPKLVLQARFPMAVAYFELHQNDDARREFEAVRRVVGDHPNVEYYLGRLDLAEGQLDSAIEELRKAAAKPPFPDTAYQLGSAYLKKHDLVSAEKWLTKAAELNPNDSAVQFRLSALYNEAGRKEEARQALERSQQLRQRDTEVDQWRLECNQKLDHGSLADARPVCEQLDDPNDADKLTMLGTIYGQHGAFEDALKPLRRAAELNPNSPQMQYNLAFNLAQLGRFQEAREPVAKAVERWPDLFPLNLLYGEILLNMGEESGAYEALQHAHELNPQDGGASELLYQLTMNLAGKSMEGKEYSSAQKYLRGAVKLRPRDPEPHRLLAEVFDATGRKAEAEAERHLQEQLKNSGNKEPN